MINFKKVATTALSLTMAFSMALPFVFSSFANDTIKDNDISEEELNLIVNPSERQYEGLDLISEAKSNNTIYRSQGVVYDFRKLSSKTYIPLTNGNTYGIGPGEYSVNSVIHDGYLMNDIIKSTSDSWTDSSHTVRFPIDRIMAEARLYHNGGIYKNAIDDNTHSSHAGTIITGEYPSLSTCELYGSHAFEMIGYENWYPETYARI